MKAADVASIVAALVLAGGAAGGFLWWRTNEAHEAERVYEAGIDRMVDGKIRAVRLDGLQARLAENGGGTAALQTLYADPTEIDRLNLGFGTLRGDWRASYAEYAEQAERPVERDRLEREVDERWGPGAYGVMSAQYDAYLADAPRRAAELEAQREREAREMIRALNEYYRRHGNAPPGEVRRENGVVVIVPAN